MAEYRPTYRMVLPLTLEDFDARVDELPPIHAYATEHDDVFVLDELFCRIVGLEHRISLWEREHEQRPRVASSLEELDRTLKWAWLARDEEHHAAGMYGSKLKDAIDVLQELLLFLHSQREQQAPQPDLDGMTQEEAQALATTIKAKLPQAEVTVRVAEQGTAWVVEAHNPRRGTSQVFLSADQFEQLMRAPERL